MTTHDNDRQIEMPEKSSGSRRIRNWTAAGLAVGLLAGTGVSLTAASPFAAGASSETEIAGDNATNDPADGPRGRVEEALQALVQDGTLTTSQLEAVMATLADARQEMRDKVRPGLEGRHRPDRDRGAHLRAELLATAAAFLEITPEELRADLRAGSTLSAIADEQGKSRDDLIAALLDGAIDSMTEKLNEFLPRLVDGEIGPRRTP